MKIIKKHDNDMVDFYALTSGDVFLFGNDYYLKINAIESKDADVIINAVRIDTGEAYAFAVYDRVQNVEAELVVL